MAKRRLLAMSIAALLGTACRGTSPAAQPSPAPQVIALRTPGSLVTATFEDNRLFGPDLEIARDGEVYRGRAFGVIVDLRATPDKIEGIVGSGRTELHCVPRASGFVLQGLYAGKLGELTVSSEHIVGQLGGCAYDLTATDGMAFRGTSVCSSAPEHVELSLPPRVLPLPPQERAVLLAILLGR